MDFVNYIKRVNWKFFGKVFLTREEIYNEKSGDAQAVQIYVKADYYNSEFDLGKNEDNNKKT